MLSLLKRSDIERGFHRLGELAQERGANIDFIVLGGTAMVLGFNARLSTKDVDIAPTATSDLQLLRELAGRIAIENT